jgi:oxygen-dependent protoporphyrinogen oxidase
MKVAVVGGGIAGLATAFFLQDESRKRHLPIELALIETNACFGGKIVSAREKDFVVEGGPDSFITQKAAAINLCRNLGLGEELIGTNDAARKVFVWSRGQLRQMPEGVMLIIPTRIMPFVRSSLVSWPGKIRMAMDLLIPPRRNDGDESLAHFVRRRLGAEALDRIAEPMIAGIYVADAEDLSLKSTFPRFLDIEKKYGSLIRGMMLQTRASRGKPGTPATSMFMTLKGGLQELTDALVARLDPASLFPGRSVMDLKQKDGGYALRLSDRTQLEADAVVLATPAFVTADLVQDVDPDLASLLRTIRYVSTATVSLGFRRADLNHTLEGFGFVVPRSEKRKIIACSWSSTKFNYRAPDGFALIRVFVGGAQAEHLAEQDEATLAEIACEELRSMMGISAQPVLTQVYRWPKGNAQYTVGHQERVAEMDRLATRHRGLYLAGSAYHGVGIPDCIQDGARVARELVDQIGPLLEE